MGPRETSIHCVEMQTQCGVDTDLDMGTGKYNVINDITRILVVETKRSRKPTRWIRCWSVPLRNLGIARMNKQWDAEEIPVMYEVLCVYLSVALPILPVS